MSAPSTDPTTSTDEPCGTRGSTRRGAICGLVALGAGAPLLAACGTSGSSTSAGGTGATASDGPLTATKDVPVGGGVVLGDQGVVVTQPSVGEFKAFSATCTHAGCAVSAVEDGQIVCRCHGSEFSIADGSVTAGPASAPLAEKPVKVSGGEVTLA